MVKRSVLNKLSTENLQKYIAPNSRYTSDAIKLAYDILKERNFSFKEEDIKRIGLLIEDKKESERKELSYEPNLVSSSDDVKSLYRKVFVLNISLWFSFIFGAYILFKNIEMVNNVNKNVIATLILFALLSIGIDCVSLPFLYEHREIITETVRRHDYFLRWYERHSYVLLFFFIRLFYSGIFIEIIWNNCIGKDLLYKGKPDPF